MLTLTSTTDEVSGDVMVGGNTWNFSVNRFLNMHMTEEWFYFLFSLGLSFLFFMSALWLLLYCWIRKFYNLIIRSSHNSFQVDINFRYGEILITYEDTVVCADIDECSEKTRCQCPECQCTNKWGGYDCQCSGGLLYIHEHDTCISESSFPIHASWAPLPFEPF